MDQGRRLALTLLALVACKSSEPAAPPTPRPADAALADEDLAQRALVKKLEIYALRREVKIQANAEAEARPTGAVDGLDFTRQGTAVVVYKATNTPFVTFSKARPFALLPPEDDVFGLVSPSSDKAAEPALATMVRATHVVFVFATQDQPLILGSSYTPGTLTATGLVYELATKQLRGGFQFSARNTELELKGGSELGNYDKLMDDLERNARAALWDAVKTRFPSAKTP